MSTEAPPRILFLNRSYWPDAEATGQLLTQLCEDLSEDFDVSVLCGQPNQNPGNESFIENGLDARRGVTINRVKNSRFPKRSLIGKLLNFFSFLWFAFWRTFRLPNVEVVVCETDPFLLPFLAIWIRIRKRCKLVFYLQDIYPDIAIAVGKANNGLLIRWLRRMLGGCYRRADGIIVLSEDMRSTLMRWGGLEDVPIHIIPNWVDTSNVLSIKHSNSWRKEQGFTESDDFVVMYSGNLGLSQDLDIVIRAASQLQDLKQVTFVFVGEGASRESLIQQTEELGVENVRFLPYQPRERLSESLSAADLHLLPIKREALDCLMPSKLYGILASGTAVLSIAPEDSELAQIVSNERVGRNLAQFEADQIAQVIRELSNDSSELRACGMRGRALAESVYDRKVSVQAFESLLYDLCNRKNPHILSSTETGIPGNGSEVSISKD